MWTLLYSAIPCWIRKLRVFFGSEASYTGLRTLCIGRARGSIFLPGADCIGLATQWHRPDATAYPLACRNCGAASMVYDWNLSYSVRSLCLPFIWLTSYPRACGLSRDIFGAELLKMYKNWRTCRKMELTGSGQSQNGTLNVQPA